MNNVKNLPIGVFDSGIGGLNVLHELCKTFKNESFIYFGDNLNAPYGNKTKKELFNLCCNAIDKLLLNNVKAVVIACNTASTNCLDKLKAKYANLIIVGTFPKSINSKNTILFSTFKTAKSKYVLQNFSNCKIVPLKNLAKDIENYYLYGTTINLKKVKTYASVKYKSVLLGCTHYIYLKEQFKKFFNCRIYDGLNEVCTRLKASLNGLEGANLEPSISFIGESAKFNLYVYQKAFGVNCGCKVVKNPKK